MKNFQLKELVFIGIMSAITFGVGVGLGSIVNIATGIPMTGGFVNAIFTAALICISVKTVKKFGVGIILWVIFGAMAIPTLTMGPPGAYKIIIGLFGGLILDLVLLIFNRTKQGYLIAGGLMSLAVMFGVFGVALYFDFPSAKQLSKYIIYIIPINFILGLFGTWLGLVLFDKRLVNVQFIKNLQGD